MSNDYVCGIGIAAQGSDPMPYEKKRLFKKNLNIYCLKSKPVVK